MKQLEGDYVEYVRVTPTMSRKVCGGDYLKKIPNDYRGLRDLIHSYNGRFITMITVTFKDEALANIDDLKEGLNKFTNSLAKYIKTQDKEAVYIGVLEHGESQYDKNPISPHYHFLLSIPLRKKKLRQWKKTGKKNWGFKSLWFDKIKNESDTRQYVSKYAKGNRRVKDYENPDEKEWLELDTIKKSHHYLNNLNEKVSFKVDTKILNLLGMASYRYLYDKMIKTTIDWNLSKDDGIPIIRLDDVDWVQYNDVEILYLLKKIIIRDLKGGELLNDIYYDKLISVFSAKSKIIYILMNKLESVAPLTVRGIQLAHDEVLKSLEKIPPRYNWNLIFSFREWRNITNAYYWDRRKKPISEKYNTIHPDSFNKEEEEFLDLDDDEPIDFGGGENQNLDDVIESII